MAPERTMRTIMDYMNKGVERELDSWGYLNPRVSWNLPTSDSVINAPVDVLHHGVTLWMVS